MVRVHKYRLYPTPAQDAALRETLERLRELYNVALQERRGLAAGILAKQVHDAGWAQFIRILAGKAERAGREFIKVDPRGTSQECSRCGAVVRKSLAVRVHACPHCGLVFGRDHNSAIVIEKRPGHGRRGRIEQWLDPPIPRSPCLAP